MEINYRTQNAIAMCILVSISTCESGQHSHSFFHSFFVCVCVCGSVFGLNIQAKRIKQRISDRKLEYGCLYGPIQCSYSITNHLFGSALTLSRHLYTKQTHTRTHTHTREESKRCCSTSLSLSLTFFKQWLSVFPFCCL